ncbi:MAG: hypothetical protein AAFR21_07895 [Pseudomonadota bacterium]
MTTLINAEGLTYFDHDLAHRVTVFQSAVRLCCFGNAIGAVDDRPERTDLCERRNFFRIYAVSIGKHPFVAQGAQEL